MYQRQDFPSKDYERIEFLLSEYTIKRENGERRPVLLKPAQAGIRKKSDHDIKGAQARPDAPSFPRTCLSLPAGRQVGQ
jgi:hypothetical protein